MKLKLIISYIVLNIFVLAILLNVACRDMTPPEAPKGLSYRHDNFFIVYSWEPINEKNIIYTIRLDNDDNVWIYAGPDPYFCYSNPRTNGTHSFEVKAIDKAGNQSQPARLEFEWTNPIVNQS